MWVKTNFQQKNGVSFACFFSVFAHTCNDSQSHSNWMHSIGVMRITNERFSLKTFRSDRFCDRNLCPNGIMLKLLANCNGLESHREERFGILDGFLFVVCVWATTYRIKCDRKLNWRSNIAKRLSVATANVYFELCIKCEEENSRMNWFMLQIDIVSHR